VAHSHHGIVVDRQSYQRLDGKFIYFSHAWPDIAYVVRVVS